MEIYSQNGGSRLLEVEVSKVTRDELIRSHPWVVCLEVESSRLGLDMCEVAARKDGSCCIPSHLHCNLCPYSTSSSYP